MKRAQLPAEALRSLALTPVEQKEGGNVILSAGQPDSLDARSPLSAALMTTFGGRGTQFSEVSLLADRDGREDYSADRAQKLDDFSFVEAEIDQTLTRLQSANTPWPMGSITTFIIMATLSVTSGSVQI